MFGFGKCCIKEGMVKKHQHMQKSAFTFYVVRLVTTSNVVDLHKNKNKKHYYCRCHVEQISIKTIIAEFVD